MLEICSAAAVPRIRDDARESGHLPVEQDRLRSATPTARNSTSGKKTGGQNDSEYEASVTEPATGRSDMHKLHLRPIGDVTDYQRRAGRSGLGLHPADQRGVVRISDTTDHEAQQGTAYRYQARVYPIRRCDLLDALTRRPADPLGFDSAP